MMKVYLYSAGLVRDFNWQEVLLRGSCEAYPDTDSVALVSSLSLSSGSLNMGIRRTDKGCTVIVKNIYHPEKKDRYGRSIYMTLCVENLTEQQARALLRAAAAAAVNVDALLWPEITDAYIQSYQSGNFEVDGTLLLKNLASICAEAPPVGALIQEGERLVSTDELCSLTDTCVYPDNAEVLISSSTTTGVYKIVCRPLAVRRPAVTPKKKYCKKMELTVPAVLIALVLGIVFASFVRKR